MEFNLGPRRCILSSIIFLALVVGVASSDSRSHLVKITTTIMIENDGVTPIVHHLMDCDEKNGHSRLSHIVAKLENLPMPITKTEDGKLWRIDLSSSPIESGVTKPLIVTKVYSHLELNPAHDVYLMPYSTIRYQTGVVKQGRPQKIKVPSEQYYLSNENKDVIDLDESTSTALALEAGGHSKVTFVDKSVISDEDFIQPESTIHVVLPSYLTMHVSPGGSWALQKFTDYTIEIRIYDAQQHQIHPSDNLDIQLISSNELVITNSTVNGTYHTIHTLNAGPSTLTAKLIGTTATLYSYGRQSQDIELVQKLEIFETLEIKPTAIVLPWIPDTKPSYEVSIFAAGGTGSYLWSTNNSALTEITYGDDTSVAKITTTGDGTAFIECTDKKSSVFTRHALLAVSKIVELSVLPSITETQLGGDILLPIAVYANATPFLEVELPEEDRHSGLVLFHDCSKIKFDVDIVEKTRFTYNAEDLLPNTRAKSCASLKFTCNQPGSSRVWISYSDSTTPLAKPIKTTTVIACYKPLKPIYPTEVGVLALQTSIELAFEGGPRPFGSRIDDHYAYIEPNNDPLVSFTPIIDRYRFNKDLHVFRARCNDYGELSVTLNVGNQPSATLPNPASSKASIKIICAKPDSVQLRPRLRDTCPLNEMASLVDTIVPISTTATTDFELTVFDDSKRKFLNISSLTTTWTFNGQGQKTGKQIEEVNGAAGFRQVIRNYMSIVPNGREGSGRLRVELPNQKNNGLYGGAALDLSSSLDLLFVENAVISPNRTIIYNHYKNIVVLTLMKGSGYFSLESIEGAQHANVTYSSIMGNHRVNVVPLSVGRASVQLDDRCMESNSQSQIISEMSIVSGEDFKREAIRPGRSIRYCADVDKSMFCIYLVETNQPMHIATYQTTMPPQTISPKPQAITTPAPTQAVQLSTTPLPRMEVTTTVITKIASIKQEGPAKNSFLQVLIGYLMTLLVTIVAITFGWVWWQKYRVAKTEDRRVAFNR